MNEPLSLLKRTSDINQKKHILKTLQQNSDFRECCIGQLPPQAEYVHSTNAETFYLEWASKTGETEQ